MTYSFAYLFFTSAHLSSGDEGGLSVVCLPHSFGRFLYWVTVRKLKERFSSPLTAIAWMKKETEAAHIMVIAGGTSTYVVIV